MAKERAATNEQALAGIAHLVLRGEYKEAQRSIDRLKKGANKSQKQLIDNIAKENGYTPAA